MCEVSDQVTEGESEGKGTGGQGLGRSESQLLGRRVKQPFYLRCLLFTMWEGGTDG